MAASVSTLARPQQIVPPEPTASISLVTAGAVLFASTSVVIGVLWDISWHQSIGRDTLFSPPHMAMYLGGVIAGVVSGAHVLRTSFAGTARERAATVGFWKFFHGHLGAWLCIWGAIAMLTSAPFDDWWHNAYGLDVKILSPPHALLALGILAIQLGAMFMVLALQNRSAASVDDQRSGLLPWLYALAAALVLLNFATMVSEYTWRIYQHSELFYRITAGVLIMPLVAAGVSGRLRWPATATAAIYFGVLLALVWILPLFPAEPKLAPVLYPLTRMMPAQFPLLLFVPAIGMDLVLQRWTHKRGWLLAATLSVVFVAMFTAVQWPFATFLNSEYARNPLFGQHLRPYMVPETSAFAQGRFLQSASGLSLMTGLALAAALGMVSARLGIGWGEWMRRVQR
ncbi:MAG TPA: hypothetical protein VK912_00880 [Longimicrobiales bacterium]|nr:hypothetical protein [Longimicrobiales bacterium]